MDNLDEGQAGGQRFERAIGAAFRVSSERARRGEIFRAKRLQRRESSIGFFGSARAASATGVRFFSAGQPVKTRIRRDALREGAVFGASAIQKNPRGSARLTAHFGGTRCVTDRTAAGGAFQQFRPRRFFD
jgi:hypothetical protein